MIHFSNFGEALDFSCCTRHEFSVVIAHKVDLRVRSTITRARHEMGAL